MIVMINDDDAEGNRRIFYRNNNLCIRGIDVIKIVREIRPDL